MTFTWETRPPAVAVQALLSTKTRGNFITASLTSICFTCFFLFFCPSAHFESVQLPVAFIFLNECFKWFSHNNKVPESPSESTISPHFFFPEESNRTFFSFCTKQNQNQNQKSSPQCAEISDRVSPTPSRERLFIGVDMQTTHGGKDKRQGWFSQFKLTRSHNKQLIMRPTVGLVL